MDIEKNRVNISLPSLERIRQVSLSLKSVTGVEEKSVAIVVKAWNAEGISVTDSCKGAYFSTALGEMFAYYPETGRDTYSSPVTLEFAEAPTEVSFELLTWPGREPVGNDMFGGSTLFVESYDAASKGTVTRSRIFNSGGHKFR
ncbi:hypothetical protein [Arthrobacter sp. H16F315]|uniref:hypothetical protein n=1 Tax=Arthrobacter sp. H16F315 TaxID=2955314 RepID=UPI002097B44D|nr:hypothetical protein [Arthrobacter sp. H16F315]MDD1477216.1 hypothetical protein [Arthrobacter sp. H16F315]